MPMLPKAANTEDNNESKDDRSVLPPMDYLAHIVKTEMKPTKKKNGHYLSTHFKVIEGPRTGAMVFLNLNLDNPNPVAVEIANKELNSICQACGLEGVEDSDELLQIPMCITVKVSPGDANYPESNEITAYKSADEYEAPDEDSAEVVGEAVEGEVVAEKLPWEEGEEKAE